MRRTPVKSSGYSRYAVAASAALTLILAVRVHELFPPLAPLRLGLLAVAGTPILLVTTTKWRRLRDITKLAPVRWAVFYLLLAVVGIPAAYFGVEALNTSIVLAVGVLVFLGYAVTEPSQRNYQMLSVWLVACVTLYCVRILTLGSYLANDRLTAQGGYDSNDIAALVSLTIPFALAIASRAPGRLTKLGGAGSVLVLLVTLVRTGSRGGILGLVAAMVVYTFGFQGAKRLKVLVTAATVGVVGLQFVDASVIERLASIVNLEDDYNVQAEEGRIAIWKRGIGYGLQRPLLGVGAGNFGEAEGRWRTSVGRPGIWAAPHNAYVQSFAELGLPGFVAFLGFLVSLVTLAFPTWRRSSSAGRGHQPELLAALASFMVTAMFLSHAYIQMLFALGGLVLLGQRSLTAASGPPVTRPRARGRRPYHPSNRIA